MSDLPFTLDQLKIIKTIHREGSFKTAAKKLYISQLAQGLADQLSQESTDGRSGTATESVCRYQRNVFSLRNPTCKEPKGVFNAATPHGRGVGTGL